MLAIAAEQSQPLWLAWKQGLSKLCLGYQDVDYSRGLDQNYFRNYLSDCLCHQNKNNFNDTRRIKEDTLMTNQIQAKYVCI